MQLNIIRGLPGAGKSTLAKQMTGVVHVEADMYFCTSGKYIFDYRRIKNAHDWCQMRVRSLLEEGKDVVVSNTFIRLWELKPYLEMAKELEGCTVEVWELHTQYGNIHSVPPTTIDRMQNSFEEMPTKWIAELDTFGEPETKGIRYLLDLDNI